MSLPSTISKHWLRTFVIIWVGQAFSMFGSMLVQFALVWWLTQKTGSATILATASLVAYLTIKYFLGPFAGAIVDRTNRKAVMIIADSMVALNHIGPGLHYSLRNISPMAYLRWPCSFVHSGRLFTGQPCRHPHPCLVPEEHLSRVAGINQALAGAMNIIAPPTGALLIGVLQLQWVLSIDILTAGLAILPLFFVHIPQPARIVASTGKANGQFDPGRYQRRISLRFPLERAILCTALCCDDQLPHQSSLHSSSPAGDQTFPWQCHSIRLDRISYRDRYRDRRSWIGSLGWI